MGTVNRTMKAFPCLALISMANFVPAQPLPNYGYGHVTHPHATTRRTATFSPRTSLPFIERRYPKWYPKWYRDSSSSSSSSSSSESGSFEGGDETNVKTHVNVHNGGSNPGMNGWGEPWRQPWSHGVGRK